MSSSRVIQALVGASTAGIVLVNVVPNIWPDMVVKRHGLPVVPSDQVRGIFEDVVKDMDLDKSENVKLFINNGYGSLCIGSPSLPYGAAIGLPRTVLYTSADELRNAGMVFKGKRLNWHCDGGKKLADALLLTEDELRFILAHEVAHLKNHDFTTNCFLPAWWLYFTYRATPILVNGVLPPVNPIIKLGARTLVWLASLLVFLHQNTKLSHNREFAADSTAAMVGKAYIQGGMSYILKKLKLNAILRELSGNEGKKLYSKEGNDLKDWSHPDLLARLRNLEESYAETYMNVNTRQSEDTLS